MLLCYLFWKALEALGEHRKEFAGRIRPKAERAGASESIPPVTRACCRGCASETATAPQQPAATRINLPLLAALAPTCREKNLCGCRPGPPTRRSPSGSSSFTTQDPASRIRDRVVTPINGYSRLLTPINAQNFRSLNALRLCVLPRPHEAKCSALHSPFPLPAPRFELPSAS